MDETPTDIELIDAVLGGHTNSFSFLVDRYQQKALQLSFGFVRNWEDAKEVTQSGFIKAYQNLHRFRKASSFSSWLYRIMVNECKDHLRKRSRRQNVHAQTSVQDEESTQWLEGIDTQNPSDLLREKELGQTLMAAIDALPFRQKSTFVLHHLQGLSLQEIADTLELRLGTVKSHLFRATEAIRLKTEPYLKEQLI